jgi:hypothetical protein
VLEAGRKQQHLRGRLKIVAATMRMTAPKSRGLVPISAFNNSFASSKRGQSRRNNHQGTHKTTTNEINQERTDSGELGALNNTWALEQPPNCYRGIIAGGGAKDNNCACWNKGDSGDAPATKDGWGGRGAAEGDGFIEIVLSLVATATTMSRPWRTVATAVAAQHQEKLPLGDASIRP